MNPMMMQILAALKQGQDPQMLAMQLLEKRMGNTQVGQNLLSLARAGNSGDIEQIVRNLAKSRGMEDFDTQFTAFKELLGVK